MMPSSTFTDEFLLKRSIPVTETGCWIWLLATVKGGYAKGSANGKSILVTRATIESRGNKLLKGEVVCHSCDVPMCVNPAHLFVGTHKDNSDDMVRKKRQAIGEDSGNSKLTNKQVSYIKSSSENSTVLSGKFNISRGAIRLIKRNITWRNI